MDHAAITLGLWALAVAVALYLLVAAPAAAAQRAGRLLMLLGVLILPAAAALAGLAHNLRGSQTTAFCLSCHEMAPYGRSLRVDDAEYVAAAHYQNRRVPRESACYTCHRDYALFGDLRTKLAGLRHVYAHYLGEPRSKIELYKPYSNRNCLHCHEGARSFEEAEAHSDEDASLAAMRAGEQSCMAASCHDVVHAVETLGEAELWRPGRGSDDR